MYHVRKHIWIVLLFAAFIHSSVFAETLIPEGLVIQDTFAPGIGEPVGKIILIQGEVIILHADSLTAGYRAEKDLLLFKGDTLICRKDGRVSLVMNDKSVLSLAGNTRITINESIYDPEKEDRSGFMNMVSGKARFWIKKLHNFKNSEFKVKTKTAIVGVRGSDFVIEATDLFTRVSTFEETMVEVVSLLARCSERDRAKRLEECEVEPTLLLDFEQIVVEKGDIEIEKEKLLPDDIEKLQQEFPFIPDVDDTISSEGSKQVNLSDKELFDVEEVEQDVFEEPEIAVEDTMQIEEIEDITEDAKTGELPMPPDNPSN